jgi:hypothetical protein
MREAVVAIGAIAAWPQRLQLGIGRAAALDDTAVARRLPSYRAERFRPVSGVETRLPRDPSSTGNNRATANAAGATASAHLWCGLGKLVAQQRVDATDAAGCLDEVPPR